MEGIDWTSAEAQAALNGSPEEFAAFMASTNAGAVGIAPPDGIATTPIGAAAAHMRFLMRGANTDWVA